MSKSVSVHLPRADRASLLHIPLSIVVCVLIVLLAVLYLCVRILDARARPKYLYNVPQSAWAVIEGGKSSTPKHIRPHSPLVVDDLAAAPQLRLRRNKHA